MTSVVAQAADLMRAQIRAGQRQPGRALPSHAKLARELHVGINSMSYAMRILAEEGYVEVRKGEGTFVRPAFAWPAAETSP